MASYGKLDEHEQAKLEACRRTRKRIAIIAISSIVLVCIVVGAVVGTTAANSNGKKPSPTEGNGDSISVSVKAVCDVTLHKEKCLETVGSAPNASSLNPEELFNYAVQITLTELTKVLNEFSDSEHMDNATSAAMGACMELIELAVDQLNETLTSLKDHTTSSPKSTVDDLRTWLSSVETYQETCMEALVEANNPNTTTFGETHLKNSTEMTSNALAIITWLGKIADSIKLNHRRLMATAEADLPMMKRRGLFESGDLKKKANIVVAQDGSGKYRTISEALQEVKEKNEQPTIIYVKKGVYLENVRVEKKKWNVVMVGDGQSKTIVSGGLNVIDGTPTFQTATFAVFGKGFMARDMGFRNTAGPAKHQAVALMASADLVVFYKCTIDAFQDTLYVHAQRQFYRECDIFGTVDFIFGNAAVVFQNCNILPRRPMQGQQNTITAQGKKDPNQNTGISIHNCTISPLDNLTDVQTFLGRPWKDFSTTVIMKSYMDGFINPKGWLPWIGDNAPDTIFYAEHLNFGPGASTKNRVKWRGLRTFLTKKEANKFTVKPFIDGKKWLPSTKVPFKSDF
ncbi:putative pectinesterase/pectinesterase inhibitor 46 [Raphanus sativus]|uniref:Pectinesterase n=1 Tax=Raphanus sativus TaxID=3726 RepID=A0A6J0MVB9_RAPSA|nr:probable pectinesterase/pectinesterase inhibitor 46 [Raphanus sativus]KAJ4908804.1 putative pectinesterase/pectinesterase inhibitor 46 [Raphanus sativus]